MDEEAISTGYHDEAYRPAETVTSRHGGGHARLAGEPDFEAPGVATLPDVPTNHPFLDGAEWMANGGITTGFGDGTFKRAAAVSRQAMSAFTTDWPASRRSTQLRIGHQVLP